jgi:hypothetical protein
MNSKHPLELEPAFRHHDALLTCDHVFEVTQKGRGQESDEQG